LHVEKSEQFTPFGCTAQTADGFRDCIRSEISCRRVRWKGAG
jgi:hypothetical protein